LKGLSSLGQIQKGGASWKDNEKGELEGRKIWFQVQTLCILEEKDEEEEAKKYNGTASLVHGNLHRFNILIKPVLVSTVLSRQQGNRCTLSLACCIASLSLYGYAETSSLTEGKNDANDPFLSFLRALNMDMFLLASKCLMLHHFVLLSYWNPLFLTCTRPLKK
jgi:hypothetical protein